MLQTKFWGKECWRPFRVSSPQGNATNLIDLTQKLFDARSFKSPRECYKLDWWTFYSIIEFLSFKSPRECYKPFLLLFFAWLKLSVSSPQGNATNNKALNVIVAFGLWFQVPKGMLQTGELLLNFQSSLYMFQVPKGMLQTGIPRGLLGLCFFVSSPQGNATNPFFFTYTIVVGV